MNLKLADKKTIGMIVGIGLLAVTLVGVTMALLNQKTQAAINPFSGSAVNIGVIETGGDKGGETALEDGVTNGGNINSFPAMTPNVAVTKEVKIKNINSEEYPTADTLVRVRLVPGLRYNDDSQEYTGQLVPMDMSGKVTYDINETNWHEDTESGETYYYYKTALAPDAVTTPLFTSVTYNGVISENAHFELQVLTEGIAAKQTVAEGVEFPWNYNPQTAAQTAPTESIVAE